ncbi:purine-nucleoside phosphorylase [Erysipelothrix sp. HDW6C]|uniref:purine-nucleoside phosphorylase n=1 Tax=Erysipelothrix sp. HDW6C TaxID=2714930 RepID=UPI0014087832|nr:purine-nucleoside phosphorylase [Erysipelothrix sp. HDW6C]QIK69615.1 purine-nucleoside phosphorylase [Erysipelothrix sp. HDW6C]
MATPHINAEKGQIAKVVLMPGDPLRAKFIAETFLKDVKQFNEVRNMFGYTGTYNDVEVSVMGSGMGQPSIGIYSYELYDQFGVEAIIRIGSAGSYKDGVDVYDVVIADSAYSESSFAKVAFGYTEDVLLPSDTLNAALKSSAEKLEIPMHEARVHSSDVFYRDSGKTWQELEREHQVACVEMESFALFANAKKLGKHAACLLTISDSFVTEEVTSAEERQNSFTKMMEVALDTASTINF